MAKFSREKGKRPDTSCIALAAKYDVEPRHIRYIVDGDIWASNV